VIDFTFWDGLEITRIRVLVISERRRKLLKILGTERRENGGSQPRFALQRAIVGPPQLVLGVRLPVAGT
jgi:hypothetical protein